MHIKTHYYVCPSVHISVLDNHRTLLNRTPHDPDTPQFQFFTQISLSYLAMNAAVFIALAQGIDPSICFPFFLPANLTFIGKNVICYFFFRSYKQHYRPKTDIFYRCFMSYKSKGIFIVCFGIFTHKHIKEALWSRHVRLSVCPHFSLVNELIWIKLEKLSKTKDTIFLTLSQNTLSPHSYRCRWFYGCSTQGSNSCLHLLDFA